MSNFVGEVQVKKWLGAEISELKLLSLDSEGEALAADAERAFLLRIAGKGPDVFDGSLFRALHTPLYVVADEKFVVPSGPPEFKVVKDLNEVKNIAIKDRIDASYVSMKALGLTEVERGKWGVVISYSYGEKDWERLVSQSPESGKQAGGGTGKIYLFGGWYLVVVVRDGEALAFLEGPMTVS